MNNNTKMLQAEIKLLEPSVLWFWLRAWRMSLANQSEPGHTDDQEEKMAAKNGKNSLLQKVRVGHYIS